MWKNEVKAQDSLLENNKRTNTKRSWCLWTTWLSRERGSKQSNLPSPRAAGALLPVSSQGWNACPSGVSAEVSQLDTFPTTQSAAGCTGVSGSCPLAAWGCLSSFLYFYWFVEIFLPVTPLEMRSFLYLFIFLYSNAAAVSVAVPSLFSHLGCLHYVHTGNTWTFSK